MKLIIGLIILGAALSAQAQVWKTLPAGVRIVGYRNVTTSKIESNFNQFRSESPLGASFRVDAATFNSMIGNIIQPGVDISHEAFNNLLVGEYKVQAEAQLNVHGTGFGYGLTDRVMVYAEVAYFDAQVKARLKRTQGNTYESTSRLIENGNSDAIGEFTAENLRRMHDINERTIQSIVTNHYGYRPIGDWHGTGYGDMETGLMIKLVDVGTTGLLWYPGVVLPTGRQDDPDILQDIGFGDGQFDFFSEMATGYLISDKWSIGGTLRYTYQAPSTKVLRVPEASDSSLSGQKGNFYVKYGDRINIMLQSTYHINDWLAVTPLYRYMYQTNARYDSQFTEANEWMGVGSEKEEHQVQLTTSLSSITPFLKKQFLLPAQINVNLVHSVAGRNIPKASRFELEFRMLF
jgi:hypothetical protein